MARVGILIYDEIGPNLDRLAAGAVVNALSEMELGAETVQQYAKSNAPWVDRTGEARQGLTSRVYSEGTDVVLELSHTAEHGYWLEVIQDGRFAIIMPTLEALGPEILHQAGQGVIGEGRVL